MLFRSLLSAVLFGGWAALFIFSLQNFSVHAQRSAAGETLTEYIGPQHHALAKLLARHIGVAEPDAAIHQLAYGLVAMAHDYCLSRTFMHALTPGLLNNDPKLEDVHRRIVGWGVALVEAERTRRNSELNASDL